MLKKIPLSFLAILLALVSIKPSYAETVMEKVSRTGVLTVGTRFDLIPYSYVDEKGDLVGYSISILNLVREEIEKKVGKPITLQVLEANDINDRIPKLIGGEIDITCDTAFTWERDKYVDFSTSYSISGIKLLVPKDRALDTPESLVGKRIGVIPNSVGEATIKIIQPQAVIVPVKNAEEGVTALKNKQVDALAGDSIVLDGIRQRMLSDDYKIVPNQPFARYGVACMVPENNSTFLNTVNYTIVKFMQGYLTGEAGPVEMVDRWIGPQGIVNVESEAVRDFFKYTLFTHEQVPDSNPQRGTNAKQ